MDTSTYRYDPLDPTKRSLRLLRLRGGTGRQIQCELIPTTLDDGLPYEGVSYTWGPNFKAATVDIDGRRLPITFNLNLILHDLRRPETDRILWVDAICIDQSNEVEKAHQVQQMRDIFGSAERVLFCISRPTDWTDFLMESLEKLQEKLPGLDVEWSAIETCWEKAQLDLADNHLGSVPAQVEAITLIQRQALKYILAQDWFKRVWIMQEVANARGALVHCGSKCVSAAAFVMGTRLLGHTADEATTSHINAVQEVLDLMPGPLKSYHDGVSAQDLYSILRQFRAAKATDERDRIFALFGLCIDTQAEAFPKVDYTKSIMEVIRDTVSYLCHCDLRDELQIPYTTLHRFLEDLDSLQETMVLHFFKIEDGTSALSLLQHAGGRVKITWEMLRVAADDKWHDERIAEQLLQQENAEHVLSSPAANSSWTPLWWAAENGHENTVRLLVEKGVDIEAGVTSSAPTALHLAAKNGHEVIVKLLLERGANLNNLAKDREYEPRQCAMHVHQFVIGLLLEKPADFDSKSSDFESHTPLQLAAENGHEAVVRLLLERGADFNATFDYYGTDTPLRLAAMNGHEAVARLLLERRLAFSALVDSYGTNTPLRLAARNGHEAVVRLLLRRKADFNAPLDSFGLHILVHITSGKGHKAIVRLLIENGADFKSEIFGDTPLKRAVEGGHEAVVELLLENGAHLNGEGSVDAPLHRAVKRGHEAIVGSLLSRGANVDVRDKKGHTPLHWAAGHRNERIARLLLEKGANIEAQDNQYSGAGGLEGSGALAQGCHSGGRGHREIAHSKRRQCSG
ncbi:ankyrin repeat-containing domain protein [Nemania sp. NC0429]|nr:ankyrin repeat-containing domain protein [Nemania sp. NC0429]